MKYFETYILLKPDSCFYFKQIENLIIKNGYVILSYQIVKNYYSFCTILRDIERKDNLVIYGLSLVAAKYETKLFGNRAIILKVKKKSANLNEFLIGNFYFKKLVRKKIGCFSSNRASLITNLNYVKLPVKPCNFSGEIKLIKNNSISSVTGLRLTSGNYCAVHINLIHIAGPSKTEHIFSKEIIKKCRFKKLNLSEIEFIKKHKTYYF